MPEETWIWKTDCDIPSETAAGRQVLEEILRQLETHDWVEHDVFGVRLAMEEALVNAIKHGNRLDVAKQVHVICRMSTTRLWIEITDEGDGFDPAEVPDPTAEENLDAPSGRGIMLMRNFMSRVEYNESGNRVVMEKERAVS